jgi:hypothetical protein
MNDPSALSYVISIEELVWGVLLVAVSLFIHGCGMILVLEMNNAFRARLERFKFIGAGFGVLVLSAWLIILVHLSEVLVWSAFFFWKGAMPNLSVAFYFALNEYTTVGSSFNLPQHWRLLEGMIATAGLLGFAWSTGTLLTLAKEFQDRQMEILQQRRRKHPRE